jgi:hypothetical protein
MKRNKLLEAAGFRYVANHRTLEIHRVENLHVNCKIEKIKHGGYCTWLWHFVLLKVGGYNGCYWCNKKENREN